MKAVILAAGNGKRMLPLTLTTPKPLLKWQGKTLIEHAIDILPKEVDEVIIVVGYLKEQFFDFFKTYITDKKITLVVQEEIAGTAPALMLCKDNIGDEKFILMYADDIHDKGATADLLKYDLALLTKTVEDARPYGVVEKNSDGVITAIIEKPENPKTNEVAVGVYLLDSRIFTYFDSLRKDSKEYFLTEMIGHLILDHDVYAVLTPFWKKITEPSDLL
ncbi:MAG: nucleotidyltransferase family protein [Candidatus Paceibacterota bacterium]|jgi:bifunctional UDP-N-acetylglucosamine pyrophosphorylase/glucosamine-1-phosphate N-acetyltransferase